MGRYIIRGRSIDSGQLKKDLDTIIAFPGVEVIDSSSEKMLLISAPSERKLKEQMEALPNWTITPESSVPLPDPRPRLKRKTS